MMESLHGSESEHQIKDDGVLGDTTTKSAHEIQSETKMRDKLK